VSESYLLILGDRDAIAWVLDEERTAFPATARAEVDRLAAGDELLIYATRGAFGNPTRDRGRVIGHAVVTSAVSPLDEPVVFGEREYPRGCELRVESLAPWGQGVELRPLVERLDAFPDPRSWSVHLRRPLLRLPKSDADFLLDALRPLTGSLPQHVDGYKEKAARAKSAK
jgi:hypothetical protein